MAKRALKKGRFPLLEHVDKQMSKLHENLASALETFDEDAIHDTRVATRRMKAALALMQPVLGKSHRKSLDRGLKKLRRRLGPLRDADVMIRHLSDLAKDRKHAAAAEWLGQRLEDRRVSLRDDSRNGASTEKELRRIADWPLVRADIGEAAEAIDSLLAESLHLQTDAFVEQADRLVADLAARRGPAEDAGHGPRQNPHDLRIAGKALRYTLEMAEAQGHSPGSRLMKSFKRMQELLGTWHDFVVLADTAMTEVVAAELTHHEAAASDRVIDLAKFAVKRSAQELSAFCKLWSQKGSEMAGRIRESFPLTLSPPDAGLPEAEPSDGAATDTMPAADEAKPAGAPAAKKPAAVRPPTVAQAEPPPATAAEVVEFVAAAEVAMRSQTDRDPAETASSEDPAAEPSAATPDA